MWPSNSGIKRRMPDEDIYKLATKEVIDKVVELRANRRTYEWIACHMYANNYLSPYKRWNTRLVKSLLSAHGVKSGLMSKLPDYRHLPVIEAMLADGVSMDDIAEHLNSQGCRTVNGYLFTKSLVKQYVHRYKELELKHGEYAVRFLQPVEDDDDI